MSSFLNGLASAGLGYYKGMDEQRAMEERKARQAQEKQLYDLRLQEAKNNAEDNARARADRQTLRTAAQPVTVEEVASSDMMGPRVKADQDYVTPGAAQFGLSQARYRTTNGQRFADKTAADAYAQTQNTPDMYASREAAAHRSIGDAAGAYKTESDQRARKKQFEIDAVDNMLKDYGKALFSGGPKALTEMASKSNVDNSDYRHETGPNGEDIYYRVNRATQKATLLGTFPGNEQGRVDAYKAFAATVSPELAMKHYAEKKAEARQDKEDKRKEDEARSQAGLRSAQARSADANAGESSAKARLYGAQADAGGYRPSGGARSQIDKPYKMDEDDKIRLTNANAEVKRAEDQVFDALKSAMPGDDINKNAAHQFAQKRVAQAKKNLFKTQFDLNQITPERLADDILSSASNAAEAMKSLGQLSSTLGTKNADAVANLVQQDDRWKALHSQSPAGKPKPAEVTKQPFSSNGLSNATPQASTEKPVRGPTEPLQNYKQRLVSWDNARMAREDSLKRDAKKAAFEEARKMALSERPDLAQMGQGLR